MKRVLSGLCLLFALWTAPAFAQSRPLITEDAETVPAGSILLEAGFDIQRDRTYPVSGLTGNLMRIGTFGFSFGVSSIAEIQLDGGVINRLAIVTRDPTAPLAYMLEVPEESTSDVEDLRIGTKVRFVSETASRPSFAIRFSTKLPNAGNESGLGMDTTDFHFGIALAKTVESVRIVGNAGFAIDLEEVSRRQLPLGRGRPSSSIRLGWHEAAIRTTARSVVDAPRAIRTTPAAAEATIRFVLIVVASIRAAVRRPPSSIGFVPV